MALHADGLDLDGADPPIGRNSLVELPYRLHVGIARVGFEDAAAPYDVVDDDQAAGGATTPPAAQK